MGGMLLNEQIRQILSYGPDIYESKQFTILISDIF